MNLTIYFLNTGCFLYPAEISCLNTEWSIPKNEVKMMSIHYEWWAKAGGGAGYSHELPKENYIKNFVWFENWVDKHFFNKVSDTFLGTMFICLVVFLSFLYFHNGKNENDKHKYILAYLFLLIFLIEWFLNHPSMRYGGYVLISLPIIIFTSSMINNFKFSKKKFFKLVMFFVILSFFIYNSRNVIRINKEIEVYGYKPLNSPYFYVEEVNSEIIIDKNGQKIFAPIGNSCWSSKTPCSYNKNLKIDKFLWLNMVYRE